MYNQNQEKGCDPTENVQKPFTEGLPNANPPRRQRIFHHDGQSQDLHILFERSVGFRGLRFFCTCGNVNFVPCKDFPKLFSPISCSAWVVQ